MYDPNRIASSLRVRFHPCPASWCGEHCSRKADVLGMPMDVLHFVACFSSYCWRGGGRRGRVDFFIF